MLEKIRVKICGLTRLEDAQEAAELGAFALGFVFYPPSPRAIAPEAAASIISALPTAPWKVGVFVNQDFETLARTASNTGLSHLQLHGHESPELCEKLQAEGFQIIKALRPRSEADWAPWLDFPFLLLLDTAIPGVWGGSGQTGDWDLAAQIARQRPILLAGGLTPENSLAAQATVQPWALDLSSGVEARPGEKDPAKLQALFQTLNTSVFASERNPSP
ncbi:phosphoribosylanthranilate isomerase [bacterium (Candidatus Blackallbacteria) CG17_big_fil_post_rev_8_21_14_2_50_48_46]|uniref:N-(5'-phosphoribosyl)anthranilate isomerase n=1 Tax=bacterium (Candidatus Blackallbacteria) CG17_big_fil_post_rev_8_21_14_2_50_48_46 TaxID=2014261 RepID=A0A2M7FYA4_9BACT|nr:MAG: phosphoribosylanthranilate isomerase [bacterium (Candidatus Blackallbacteria) CG18_big_fil_WC_8_21_14_2_50_49_26]PIW14307.1 MAG: phosphoribosylanthranilate isomerase [bacterium (Candidatus Blackallbacteria) CG17_big_fil_post_rev_8_21_14_2_50_48_46]PIW45576.1 MAG: phosphoribosylanthranilate isomerase [bacterium (Candidatus Blackallbacteria) CG13_big_fil_rev_8_21_14_2_50_49_14]